MTGTTIAQAIPIAISPILTRIYTPEDFGLFALYMSIASIIAVIATGRYELAIMLPKKKSDAIHLVWLSLIIAIGISLLSFVIISLFSSQIANLLNAPQIEKWLYFIPFSILITGSYQSFNFWHNRNKNYSNIAQSRVLQSSLTGISNIAMGLAKFNYIGMIIGSIIGQGVATLFLGKITYSHISNVKIYKNKLLALAKKYKKFPLINSLHAFINIFKDNFVNIFISLKYTTSVLGFYFFMMKIMKIPSSVLGSSLAQVFYKEATEEYQKTKNIQQMVFKFIFKLFLIAFFPILFLALYSEELFAIFFGEAWREAGRYAENIAPYILFHFIASPMGMVPLIVDKQEKAFFWGLFESILFVSIFIFSYKVYASLETTLSILSIVMVAYFIIYFFWIYHISKAKK